MASFGAGCLVRIHEVRERPAGDIFRCSFGDNSIDRRRGGAGLDVRPGYLSSVRVFASPLVDLAALRALRELLADAIKDTPPANSPSHQMPWFLALQWTLTCAIR